jgi:hypothetical protein
MLDAYIIERIRREREADRDGALIPLRIEVPDEPAPVVRKREEVEDRGSVIIDFNL